MIYTISTKEIINFISFKNFFWEVYVLVMVHFDLFLDYYAIHVDVIHGIIMFFLSV